MLDTIVVALSATIAGCIVMLCNKTCKLLDKLTEEVDIRIEKQK